MAFVSFFALGAVWAVIATALSVMFVLSVVVQMRHRVRSCVERWAESAGLGELVGTPRGLELALRAAYSEYQALVVLFGVLLAQLAGVAELMEPRIPTSVLSAVLAAMLACLVIGVRLVGLLDVVDPLGRLLFLYCLHQSPSPRRRADAAWQHLAGVSGWVVAESPDNRRRQAASMLKVGDRHLRRLAARYPDPVRLAYEAGAGQLVGALAARLRDSRPYERELAAVIAACVKGDWPTPAVGAGTPSRSRTRWAESPVLALIPLVLGAVAAVGSTIRTLA